MKIISLEILAPESAKDLACLARRERRNKKTRLLNMTAADLVELHLQDLSELRAQAASALPAPMATHDEPARIFKAIREGARDNSPLLVTFSRDPSKKFVDELRSVAKRKNCRLRFHRLIRKMALVEILENEAGNPRVRSRSGATS